MTRTAGDRLASASSPWREGHVVCPRRGIVDLTLCWGCPAYRGLTTGPREGVICGTEPVFLPTAARWSGGRLGAGARGSLRCAGRPRSLVTILVAIGPSARVPASPDLARERPLAGALVEVLACGDPDGGDDGASIAALGELAPDLPSDVSVRLVGQLDIDDLLALPPGAGAVVVDTATGVDPGWVVEIPFIGFAGRASAIRARSSVTLSRPETVGLASMIRGRPLVGVLVAIGGASFRPGEALSWPVGAGLGSFRVAIVDAIERVRTQVIADALPNARGPDHPKEDRPVAPIAVRA